MNKPVVAERSNFYIRFDKYIVFHVYKRRKFSVIFPINVLCGFFILKFNNNETEMLADKEITTGPSLGVPAVVSVLSLDL